MDDYQKFVSKIVLFNRQPTLWRHSMPGVYIVPSESYDDYTIGVSPLTLAPLNMD